MSQKQFKPDIENQNVDDIVQEILGGIPVTEYAEVKLPSLATDMYELADPVIHLRPMTFADEKAILSVKNKQGLNLLLERCIEEDLNPRNLLVQDKLTILFHLRALSVGPDYDLNVTCSECETASKITLNILESFPINYAEEPVTKTKTITLPVLGKEALIKRVSSYELEQNDNILNELWRYVLEIAGNSNAKVRAQVIDKLPRKDIHYIIEEITLPNLGIDKKFIYKCSNCKHEEIKEMQLSTDFFTMK
jgi:hypothetical protein